MPDNGTRSGEDNFWKAHQKHLKNVRGITGGEVWPFSGRTVIFKFHSTVVIFHHGCWLSAITFLWQIFTLTEFIGLGLRVQGLSPKTGRN